MAHVFRYRTKAHRDGDAMAHRADEWLYPVELVDHFTGEPVLPNVMGCQVCLRWVTFSDDGVIVHAPSEHGVGFSCITQDDCRFEAGRWVPANGSMAGAA